MDFNATKTMFAAQILATSLVPLREELIERAIVYSRIRVDHLRTPADQQRAIGHDRTAAHNAFIAACDGLAEKMDETGEDGSWRLALGQDRKVIGDFACYIHCILGLSAR